MLVGIGISLLIVIVLTLLVLQYKNKKNIGQKISFLYNQMYSILILSYYSDLSSKNDILKEEVLDYYKNIVINENIDSKYKNADDIKGFVLQYYTNYSDKLSALYDMLDMYYNKYYNSLQKSIILLLYLLLILLVVLIIYII